MPKGIKNQIALINYIIIEIIDRSFENTYRVDLETNT